MASIANLIIDQGSTFTTVVTPTNADGSLLELSNFSPRGTIRKSFSSSASTAFTSTITNNTSPTQDTVTISLTSTQTAALKPGSYVYDVEVRNSAQPAKIHRILEGQLEITPSVTQTLSTGGGIGNESPSS